MNRANQRSNLKAILDESILFVCIFSLLHSSYSPAIRYQIHIWIVHTSCDNKISCPFKHFYHPHITHKMDVWHVKPMTTMSACHFDILLHGVRFFSSFALLKCVFFSHLYLFCGFGQRINSQKLFDLKKKLLFTHNSHRLRAIFIRLAWILRYPENLQRFSDNRFHDFVFATTVRMHSLCQSVSAKVNENICFI